MQDWPRWPNVAKCSLDSRHVASFRLPFYARQRQVRLTHHHYCFLAGWYPRALPGNYTWRVLFSVRSRLQGRQNLFDPSVAGLRHYAALAMSVTTFISEINITHKRELSGEHWLKLIFFPLSGSVTDKVINKASCLSSAGPYYRWSRAADMIRCGQHRLFWHERGGFCQVSYRAEYTRVEGETCVKQTQLGNDRRDR